MPRPEGFGIETPRKLKTWPDTLRKEHAVRLIAGVPLRIHATNGAYLFSIYADAEGRVYRYNDKRWGDKRVLKAQRVTGEKPI